MRRLDAGHVIHSLTAEQSRVGQCYLVEEHHHDRFLAIPVQTSHASVFNPTSDIKPAM